ncbi:DUF4190 domain-containing protein [Kineococcus sp. T13]|uniref:DUF4190 domain-containing protein n=1 Tax=Kineococcus vitellinus TaxID=2696565 RepID=UPI0014134F61|nr:DUF4190 domain-containing protein [Kineococcus vitellinus]NAZ74580.1 DUF4190 domain-containing protein [Kineococcus vitellinus]
MAEQHGQGSYPSGQQGGYGAGYGSGQGGYSEPYGAKPRNAMAVVALVLGIVALLLCWVVLGLPLAIVGLILGIVAMRRAKRGLATNRGTAIAAVVVNAVALLASAVLTAVYIAAGAAFWNNGGADYAQCIRDAGSDQVAAQACQERYQDEITEQLGS